MTNNNWACRKIPFLNCKIGHQPALASTFGIFLQSLLAFVLVLIISCSSFAQNKRTKLRPKSYEDIVKSAQAIRNQEKEIRTYFMQIVLRKAQMDVVTILQRKRMGDEDIEKVLQSKEMSAFLSRIESNPKIIARVNMHVEKLVRPGAIEAHVLKQREQIAKKQQDQLIMATNELRKSSVFRSKEEVHAPVDDRTLASKIWNHLVSDLYEN
jgi:hypothetical protein